MPTARKLLISLTRKLLPLLTATIATAVSQVCAAEKGSPADIFNRLFEKVRFECSTLTITVCPAESSGSYFCTNPRLLNFSTKLCRNRNEESRYRKALALYAKAANQRDNQSFIKLMSEVQHELKSLRNLCRELIIDAEGVIKSGQVYRCYFDGPSAHSSTASAAMFNIMLTNRWGGDEARCTPDPIGKSDPRELGFVKFLEPGEKILNWDNLERRLQKDRFVCDEVCIRVVPAVEINSPEIAPAGDGHVGDIFFPRLLQVYKGNWRFLSGGLPCLESSDDKEPMKCSSSPRQGSSSGICVIPEDWHIWGRTMIRLDQNLEEQAK